MNTLILQEVQCNPQANSTPPQKSLLSRATNLRYLPELIKRFSLSITLFEKNNFFLLSITNMDIDLREIQFLRAANSPGDWVPDIGSEIAFAGRSNVGKSSAINAITNRKGMARTSKTPGRTQQIVFFELSPTHRLVDLPGYGFAKVPKAVKHHWTRTVEHYLSERESLKGLILLMDARRPLTELDQQMLYWSNQCAMPVHILLTKSDKLSKSQAGSSLIKVQRSVEWMEGASVQLFSTLKKHGVDTAQNRVRRWLSGR